MRDAEAMKDILIVEPDPASPRTWRFGRVDQDQDAVGEESGILEITSGDEIVLRRSHPDAITATLLLRNSARSTDERIVYRFPSVGSNGTAARHPSATSERPPRATAGRAKGGSGETLAERAERLGHVQLRKTAANTTPTTDARHW